ncbi:hypothetical protein WA171_002141 [Blastocystis sp. BT1]
MSDNPFEDGSSSPVAKSKTSSSKNPMASVKSMDIGRALSQLRWINMLLGVIIIVFNIFGILGNLLNPGVILMNAFSIVFAGILCLYEMQMKKLGQKLRRLYGFLYTYIGRSLYLVFLGTILFTIDAWYNIVLGIIIILDAAYNVLILFCHPAFKNGQRKITDDPTQNYTAGESEITNIMKNNPALAQKMLVGASKLAQ